MDNIKDNLEFNVLGYQVKFSPAGENNASPKEAVELVRQEASLIRAKAPSLADGQVAVLVALKLASEKLNLSKEYKDNIQDLKKAAQEALKLVESAQA
jgi:cell division protein ZapA (FtsZ GTPase activity inhibitor)